MKRTSKEYIQYLVKMKNISDNTQQSYRQDLDKMIEYFHLHHLFDYEKINDVNINSYILHLELERMSSSTIHRKTAVIKGYFDYLFRTHRIKECVTEKIQKPVLKRREIESATQEEVEKIFLAVEGDSMKHKRDRLILLLICRVGIQITELIELKIANVNLEIGFILCGSNHKVKTYALSHEMLDIMKEYIEIIRPQLVESEEEQFLFVNLRGEGISRQGIWKIVKHYGDKAGIEDITPSKLGKVSSK